MIIMHCVYKHINKINGKVYIGITSNLKRRWSNSGKQYVQCTAFYNAIKKYGWNNFDHIVLFDGLSKEEAETLERQLINENRNICYNIADGGDGGPILFGEANPNYNKERTKEHCRHLSESLKGRTLSNDTKEKISINNKMKRKIQCLETLEVFDSITLAAEKFNTHIENIWRVVSGKRKSWHNYHFVYLS